MKERDGKNRPLLDGKARFSRGNVHEGGTVLRDGDGLSDGESGIVGRGEFGTRVAAHLAVMGHAKFAKINVSKDVRGFDDVDLDFGIALDGDVFGQKIPVSIDDAKTP